MGLKSFFGHVVILPVCADDFQITSKAEIFLLRLRYVYLVPCWLLPPACPIDTFNLADLAILPPRHLHIPSTEQDLVHNSQPTDVCGKLLC